MSNYQTFPESPQEWFATLDRLYMPRYDGRAEDQMLFKLLLRLLLLQQIHDPFAKIDGPLPSYLVCDCCIGEPRCVILLNKIRSITAILLPTVYLPDLDVYVVRGVESGLGQISSYFANGTFLQYEFEQDWSGLKHVLLEGFGTAESDLEPEYLPLLRSLIFHRRELSSDFSNLFLLKCSRWGGSIIRNIISWGVRR